MDSTITRILECIDRIGIIIEPLDGNDISLSEYIEDSVTFIQFIIEIEEEFEIDFPDTALGLDILSSLAGFAVMIDEIISNAT